MTNKTEHLDIVNIRNILSIPFEFEWDGEEQKTLAVGEVRPMPRFLANHVIKRMVDYIIIHDMNKIKSLNDDRVRDEIEKKIYAGVKEKQEATIPVIKPVNVDELKRQELLRLAFAQKIKNPQSFTNIQLREELKKVMNDGASTN